MAHSRSPAFGAIKQLREERGLSQEAATLACGIDRYPPLVLLARAEGLVDEG